MIIPGITQIYFKVYDFFHGKPNDCINVLNPNQACSQDWGCCRVHEIAKPSPLLPLLLLNTIYLLENAPLEIKRIQYTFTV